MLASVPTMMSSGESSADKLQLACAMCGKSLTKEKSSSSELVVQGQKFSAK